MDTSVVSLKYSRGFSLLEVLVAIVISTILMGGAIMMLSSNKRVYAVQSELAQLQGNARFIMDELNRELRIAGHFGCSGTPPDPDGIYDPNDPSDDPDDHLLGEPTHPFQGSMNILTGMKETASGALDFPASDIIAVNSFNQQMTVDSTQKFQKTITTSFDLDENNEYWPVAGETIIVSDCTRSDRYLVTTPNPENIDGKRKLNFTQLDGSTGLIENYSIHPEIFTGKTHIRYEVKARAIAEPSKYKDGFALYQTRCENIDGDLDPCEDGVDIVGEDELLVENVETLQVRYGFNIVLDDGALGGGTDGVNDVLAFDDNGDNQTKLIPDFFDADSQPFCDTLDTDGTPPDTYSFCTMPDRTKVIFPIVAVRITLLMRTASKRYDQKTVLTDELFQLDPDTNERQSEHIPYNPKDNSLESAYRHRMFTTVMAVRNAKQ